MLSNTFLLEIPWHQHGWNGVVCTDPGHNSCYCLPNSKKYLVRTCMAMAGHPHLCRDTPTEAGIRPGLARLWSGADSWQATPVVNLHTRPDPLFGRLHGPGQWRKLSTLSSCRHLRPDPWCSPSITAFKEHPTGTGLGNLWTDDRFSFSVMDYKDALHLPDSPPTPLPHGKPLFAIMCCATNPVPTLDEEGLLVVGAVRITAYRKQGELVQFKGDSALRLPFQEMMRCQAEIAPEVWQDVMEQAPITPPFPYRFKNLSQCEAEQLVYKLLKTAQTIKKTWPDTSAVHDALAGVSLEDWEQQFLAAPSFAYPNLGRVLAYCNGGKSSASEHATAYFKGEEEELKITLDGLVAGKPDWNNVQKDFFTNHLVYFDIDTPYMQSIWDLCKDDYSYQSHWGVINRDSKFGPQVLDDPYQLTYEVTLVPKKTAYGPTLPNLRLDFKTIDDGVQLRHRAKNSDWDKDNDPQRSSALLYDRVFQQEREDDLARVEKQQGDPTPPQFLICSNGWWQRTIIAKATELLKYFYGDDQVSTPDDFFTNEDVIDALKATCAAGFQSFFQTFPEATATSWDNFCQTEKGKKVIAAMGEQTRGIEQILRNRFTIITGKAGAGKSEMFKNVVETLKGKEAFLFLAPTGKAVQAIQEKIMGIDGLPDECKNFMTIDKFLVTAGATNEVLEPGSGTPLSAKLGFQKVKNKKTVPLFPTNDKPCNIIIDEASMIDLIKMGNLCHLLSELWRDACIIKRFVLVGDINQLPPVQSGYPFRILLHLFEAAHKKSVEASSSAPFGFQRLDVSLRFIKGESEGLVLTGYADSFSGMKTTQLTAGPSSPGELAKVADTDNLYVGWFNDRDSLIACLDRIFTLKLPFATKDGTYRIDWTPREAGNTEALPTLRDALHGNMKQLASKLKGTGRVEADHIKSADPLFLSLLQFITPTKKNYFGSVELGELVRARYPECGLTKYIQTVNDNDKELYNGNLAVKFSNRLFYSDSGTTLEQADVNSFEVAKKIEPAYAITVHKSQGSGFSITVAVLPESIHRGLKSAELQYTAVTRTKDICILLRETMDRIP